MQVEDYKQYTKNCFQGTIPPCICVCPLKVDVRAFIDKVQKGNFNAAFRLYRNQVIFPRIVSQLCDQPCKGACIGSAANAPIDMRYIEKACVQFATSKNPTGFNVPPKNKSIAIIGAGLSGMACALKLASRNYSVTVYEKEAKVGGRLKSLMDEDIYLSEFEDEFSSVSYQLITSKEISDLSELQTDAVYIATGKGGNDFGLKQAINKDSLATEKLGVFLGGSLIGTTPMESIEHGIRVSHSIEKYLKTGLMDGVPETYEKTVLNDKFCVLSVDPISPLEGKGNELDADLAIAEANRCLKCDCSLCIDACDLMQTFNKNPHRIVQEVISSLQPIELLTKRIASRMANSCNQCGTCKEMCPEDIDMGDCLMEARRHFFRDGAMPEAYHDFWLRDMDFANSDEASALILPESGENSEYMFFPGCQLGASNPDYVLKAYDFLREVNANTSLLVGCCSVPADWAADEELRDGVLTSILESWRKAGEPIVILACPTCMKTFSRYLQNIETRSLYDIMQNHISSDWKKGESNGSVSVYDPCASRYDSLMQESVRRLLKDCGYHIEELDYSGKNARCCSYGGHIHAVNPEQVKKITANRIAQNDKPYVTYCSNCRDTFASAGKDCSHILDIIFGTGTFDRNAPDLSQRRLNRVELMRLLKGLPKGGDEQTMGNIRIIITPELQAKMNEHLILEDDVRAVIEHCEATDSMLENKATGEFIGHLSVGAITYWVIYSVKDSSYELRNVYTHRMKIKESSI